METGRYGIHGGQYIMLKKHMNFIKMILSLIES